MPTHARDRHQPLQHHSALDDAPSEAPAHEYQQGQHVRTIDGIAGVVTAVYDTPIGDESYHVTLDHGLGEGEYTSSQISPVTASVSAQGAAVDYPELAQVLADYPDPAGTERYAVRKTAYEWGDEDGTHYSEDYEQCPECGEMVNTAHGSMEDHLEGEHDADPGDYEHERGSAWERKTSSKTAADYPTDGTTGGDTGPHSAELDQDGHLSWDGHSPASGEHDPNNYSMLPDDNQANVKTSSLLALAAADPEMRFHVIAAWKDVVAKAKRIRSEHKVHIVVAKGGIVIGEVQGDHAVYEAGLQHRPGRTAGIHAYTCGCPWGSYHANKELGNTRFAGRMCSHALALRYEAQSRGMFGRDVYIDDYRPKWVPARVQVSYDKDTGSPIDGPAPKVASIIQVPTDSPLRHLANDAWLAGTPVEDTMVAFRSAGIPLRTAAKVAAEAYGLDTMVPENTGATRVPIPGENPGSTGWASSPDSRTWDNPSMSKNPKADTMSTVGSAYWNPLDTSPSGSGQAEPDPSQEAQQRGPGAAGAGRAVNTVRSTPPATTPASGAVGEAAGAAGAGEAAAGAAAGAGEAAAGEAAAGGLARLLPMLLLAHQRVSELQDEPEGALPYTTGDDDDDLDYGTALPQVAASKVAMKNFTAAERAEIINEGRHARAANRDRMDVTGTHYEHQTDEDDDDLSSAFLG